MNTDPHAAAVIDPVLRDALDVLSEGLAVFDAQGRAVVWNARYARTWANWGMTMTPAVLFTDLLRGGVAAGRYDDVPGDLDAWVDEMLDRRMNGEAFDDLRLEFGEYLRFHTRPTPNGGFVITCLDVTDLKLREAKALAAQSFLDTVVENVPAMFVVKDGETGKFILVNRFAEQALGVPRTALLGKTDHELFPQDQADYFLDYDRKVMASDKVWTIEEEPLDTPHNGRRWLQTRKVAIPFADGRRNLLTICEDITERKQSAAALAEALERAEAASVAKSEFLANMSHEIRTPLNGVIGMAEVMSRTALSDDQREMMQTIIASGRTLNRLLSDILDLSKVESGALTLSQEPLDLRETICSAVAVFEAVASEKGVDFEVGFEDGFAGRVMADGLRLRQIVANLTSNAVKFTSRGAVRIRASTAPAHDGQIVLTVSVADSGEGFDDAVGDRLFERFQQADGSVTRKFGGSGLGLPIARQFARLMGGDISWAAQKGLGATFTFRAVLPLTDIVETAATDPVPTAEPDRRLRILLAEDHPVNQKVVLLMLGQDADVTVAGDGQAAVQAFESSCFDVILMDSQMPVMDGLAATASIRAREMTMELGRTPIISLTANAMPHQVAACLEAGADLHLSKPISMASLFETINAAVALGAPNQTVADRRKIA